MRTNFKSPYLIGEVGINHNGYLDLAKKIYFQISKLCSFKPEKIFLKLFYNSHFNFIIPKI